jgi:lantibiotic modifying enzyme
MIESIIKLKIDLIAECIFKKKQKDAKEDFGLYSGQFGILLFLLYYSMYTQDKRYVSFTENYAKKILQQFIEKEKRHTFCSGFSGILYLFEFLREKDIIDLDIREVQPLLDNYIVFNMRHDMQQKYYDFMHGALGVGLYFIKRKTNLEYIHELIDFLYFTAEKDAKRQIFKWESIINSEKNLTGYNLALSHGISSIIIFLVRVIRSGVINDKIREMLIGAINFVLSNQKDYAQFGSFFPSFILKSSPEEDFKSRLGWCYGDLGVGIALFQSGNTMSQTDWKEKGVEILLQSTCRRSFDQTKINEAGICHGSAGIAMIYQRMFLETGYDQFKNAIPYWIQQTLNYSKFEDGLVGYKTFENKEWKCDFSLLTGISGIGLVLLSYIDKTAHNWDEMFLIT